ncbi:13441_t:CDS:10 [Entrophospora sp. SA101]|nr:13441_t:CDS:10 [Entrophospora sp. SA101]
MFIKIPSFGIAKFCDLNKIINLHTAMLFQTNFINLINWVDNLCTLANQNYVNDMVIESVLRIFKAFKDDDNKNNNFILVPIYLYTHINDEKFDIAYNLLVVKLDLDTKKIYFSDSLYYQAPIDLITNINRLFEFYGISFEDEVYYIGEIPYQCGTLDCGIMILNYIEKEIGISNKLWDRKISTYFRLRYLSLILNYNLEGFDFPSNIGALIESKFPSLQSYSTEIDDECKTIEIDEHDEHEKIEIDEHEKIEIDEHEKIEINECEIIEIDECETIKIDTYSMEVDGYEHMSMDNGWFETNQDISKRIGVIELSLSKCWDSLNNAIADVKKYAYEQGFSASIESSREYGVYLRLSVEIKYQKFKTQGIHITKIENTHNHQITQHEIEYYSYKSVDKEIWDEIELYVGQKLGLPQIRGILENKYPEIKINDIKLNNFIQSVKKVSKDDAAELYKMLTDRKNINPEWFVEFYVDNDNRRLNRIFWMNPVQLKNWYKYKDIVIIDTTYKTNKFNMILCFVLDNESLENFNWFFKCLKSAVSNSPKVIMSDHDLAMESAIEQQFQNTHHFLYFKNLLDSISIISFDNLWDQLIQKYFNGNVDNYLNKHLYNVKNKWAWCWKNQIMTAGIKTTSRLEEKIKINSWYLSKNINYGFNNTIIDVYKEIIANMKIHLSDFSQSLIKIEMVSSYFYQCNISTIEELCVNNSDNDTNTNDINNEDGNNFDIFDVRGSSLHELILAAEENPSEIWKLYHYNSNKNQYVPFLRSSKILNFHISVITKRWFKDPIDDNKLKKENILSSNCIRTYNEPNPFVETFGESSKKFLKINPPAIVERNNNRKDNNYITVFDKFRKVVKIADEDKEKYLLVEKALKDVYLEITKEENEIKTPLKPTGDPMPLIGFGTWQIPKDIAADTVYHALKNGYQLLDGSPDYGNEKEVGDGIKKAIDDGFVKREDIFITSKLWNTYHKKEHVRPALERTLNDLNVKYLDLYLIHFPISLKYVDPKERYPPEWYYDTKNKVCIQEDVTIRETWEAMEELVDAGLVRNIGVSNFNAVLIMDLLKYARIKPSVLQIEHHPYLTQEQLVDYAKSQGLAVTAYSPLGSSNYAVTSDVGIPHILNAPKLEQVANKYIIPKSINQNRIVENSKILDFTLTDEEIKEISSLNRNIRSIDPGTLFGIPIFA